ncbi:MAG: T9SS type A sorting domain-containing protein [Flavobacteriales bacterium]
MNMKLTCLKGTIALRNFSLAILISIASQSTAQLSEEWHTEINGSGDFSDVFTCVDTDDEGNMYFGGSAVLPGQNSNYLIAAFKPDGSLDWAHQYNAPGNGPDDIKDIVVKNGKVYVTGYGNNVTVGNDFWTLCFSVTGDSLWANMYNDPTYNQYDQANALFVDDAGNVYVTGESDRDITGVTNDDFLTIKLSPTGDLLWAQRMNGAGNATDRAEAVVVDASGNSFVTGRSENGNDDDYRTIKYDANGNELWAVNYDNGGNDRAVDMGIDDSGNIYVTGRRDNGNNDDYTTVKYNTSGALVYTKILDFVDDDRPEGIAVNGDGSFAVTGRSDANANATINWNYYTVKYDAAGTQQWTATYNGIANNDDVAVAVDLNADGQVVVTGYSDSDNTININNNIVSILYNNAGTQIWTDTYTVNTNSDAAFDVVFAPSGNAIVAGFQDELFKDAVGIYIDQAGTQSATVYGLQGDNTENIRDIAVDGSGNVFITGYSVGLDTDRNLCTLKLNPSGDTLWSRTITGSMFGSDDDAFALALDNTGNVVIAGYIKNSGTGSDMIVAKYNTNGTLLWQSVYDGVVHESDRAYDMVLDAAGNVYITGKVDIDPTITANDEVFTAKYTSGGISSWTAQYTGGTGGSERGKLVRVAASGNVYVCGRKFNGTDEDILIIKYNNAGAQQWAVTYNGANGNDDPTDMELDANENVLITGTQETAFNSLITDYLTLKYDNAGNLIWDEVYAGTGGGIDVAEALDVFANGDVVVTGYADSDNSANVNNDAVTIKYNTNGGATWTNVFDNNGLDDAGDDVAVSEAGQVFVTSHINVGTSENLNYDLKLFAITNAGSVGAAATFALSDSSDVGNKITITGNEIFIGGSTWNQFQQRNKLVLKYAFVDAVSDTQTESYTLTLKPNPANEGVFLTSTNQVLNAQVTITDMLGRTVRSHQYNSFLSDYFDVSDLEEGLYNCTLTTSTYYRTIKFFKSN